MPAIKGWRKNSRLHWSNTAQGIDIKIRRFGYKKWRVEIREKGQLLGIYPRPPMYLDKYTEAENYVIRKMYEMSGR